MRRGQFEGCGKAGGVWKLEDGLGDGQETSNS